MSTCSPPSPLLDDSIARFEDPFTGRNLSIRLAETSRDHTDARELVARMYKRKGYPTEGIMPEDSHNYWTLLLTDESGTPTGTMTVGSGSQGLRAEESYPKEIQALKQNGRRLCEFNALAALPGTGSTFSLARLFHAGLLLGGRTLGHTSGVVEVTRSHARFYERILGFDRAGEGRQCSRVGVPSVLLTLDFSKALLRAGSCGTKVRQARQSRSLYSLVFAHQEAQALADTLSTRLFAPARFFIDRCNGFSQNLLEAEPAVPSRSGHPPSALA